jgi:hypothetical protein
MFFDLFLAFFFVFRVMVMTINFYWILAFIIYLNVDCKKSGKKTHVSLSMKEGSLFCLGVMRSSELGCFRSCFWVSLESSRQGGVHGLGRGAWAWHDYWTCGAKVLEY